MMRVLRVVAAAPPAGWRQHTPTELLLGGLSCQLSPVTHT